MQGAAALHSPMVNSGIVLRPLPIEALAARPPAPGPLVRHAYSLAPLRVNLAKLATGAAFFERWPVREFPEHGGWRWPAYQSFAPPLFVLNDATVHSSAGIIAAGHIAIAETLVATQSQTHHYTRLAKDIVIAPREITRVEGTHISLLTGGAGNYAGAILEGLARIIAVTDPFMVEATSILIPKNLSVPRDIWRLLDLAPSMSLQWLGDDETLQVENLILPLSVCGDHLPHPCVMEFFRRISSNVAPHPGKFGRRIFLTRGIKAKRPLLTENELMVALTPLGFQSVNPEVLSMEDQVRLFRGAEASVAPHGAALANLGFARPGALIVEVMMDAYVNWGFRHLAALAELEYDCVLGRARTPWPEIGESIDRLPWQVSVQHVRAAVEQHFGERLRAA